MTRTELCRKINDLMTAEGCSLTEDQDAVLAAALTVMWDEITGADQEPVGVLFVGSDFGDELEDWEFAANQGTCDKLNEKYVGNPQALQLYTKEPK